ncbi:hypothetical protein UlMin_035697 [Ulmus minor]
MEQFRGQSRLPKFAVPKQYTLRLKPDLNSGEFAGYVTIEVEIVADTSYIVLNVADISIRNGSIWFHNRVTSEIMKPSKVERFEEDEILVLEFTNTLPIGVGVLAISFDGILNDRRIGFFRSTYVLNGKKEYIAVARFETDYARRCFPCWDEPALKATFKVILDVPSELTALSNMPVIEEKVKGHLKTVSFQESPKMSTYLVAIVVGLFDYVEDHTSDGVKVRVYSQVGKTNQGKFALGVAVKMLEFFKGYFAEPYSLPKFDMVAIPYLGFAGMKNYGLVIVHEVLLLHDDQHAPAAHKQKVVIAVTNEIAHQWFGNLVTMEWWTQLWLKEGFATWVSYLVADSLFPESKLWTQFTVASSNVFFGLDALVESHPIELEINHASEVEKLFEAKSYERGAAVIRMLQNYLGAECFQKSIATYIKKHASSNARTEDLWATLEEGSGKPVHKLMNSWTKQQGYPVVSVKNKDQKLEFEQAQFLSSGCSHGDRQWIIPITLCYGSYNICKSFLLQTKSDTIDINDFPDNKDSQTATSNWIKLNVDQTGVYRVKYDEDLAARLRDAIKKKYLTTSDRFGILDDSFAFCMTREESLTSLLTLMKAYSEELDYGVLSNLITISHQIARLAFDAMPNLRDSIKKFLIGILQNCSERLGWEPISGEDHTDAVLREEVLTALAMFGHGATLKEADRRFRAFLKDRKTPLIRPEIRKAVYVAVMQGVKELKKAGYRSLLEVYKRSDRSADKALVLSILTSCPDPKIVLKPLDLLFSSEVHAAKAWPARLYISVEGRDAAWTWLKKNWGSISAAWGNTKLLSIFIGALVSLFATSEMVKEIEEFFASRTLPSFATSLRVSLEQARINAKWVQSNRLVNNHLVELSPSGGFQLTNLTEIIRYNQ